MNKNYVLYFDDPEPEVEATGYEALENTITSADQAPAQTIYHINRLIKTFSSFKKVLGIVRMTPANAGDTIKRFKTTVVRGAKQAAEGEIVPLSKVKREPLDDLKITLDPVSAVTSAQAIQKVGKAIAIDNTDRALVRDVFGDIRKAFFDMIAAGTGTASAGATVQKAAANVWGALNVYFEDYDVTPVYFLNPMDVSTYLGDAVVATAQNFEGFKYLENFLGMGSAVITAKIPQGYVYATAAENLNGAYVPQTGDVSDAFELTYDETGLVGMTHGRELGRASIQTLILTGVVFYPEDQGGIFKAQISA